MPTFKNPIDQFIKELGSTSQVALDLGLAPSVVSTWRKTGKVPKWRVGPMLDLARKKGVTAPPGLAA